MTTTHKPAQAGSPEDDLNLPGFLDRNKPKKTSWHDILPVHPACAAFPDMSHEELVKLGEDIKPNGLQQKIVVQKLGEYPNQTFTLLDGKNRLQAMELVGIEFQVEIINVKRRGASYMTLVPSQDPEREDICIPEDAVAKVRSELERAGDVETVSTSIDTRGRKQPAKKAKPSSGEAATVARFKAAVKRHEEAERDRAECIALNNKCIEAEKALADHKATQGQKINHRRGAQGAV